MNISSSNNAACGTLYVVATPIGNLGDISRRACEVLQQVNLVLAEDTRSFKRLAAHLGISTPALSYHDHNEAARTPQIISQLVSGKNIALVSDAGTPTINDPGYRLLSAAREHGLNVVSIPGPCALIAAAAISGLPLNQFTFYGFLPNKGGKRKTMLAQALNLGHTSIFYESPHRIIKTLADLEEIDSTAEVFLARELTKIHEESLRGNPSSLRKQLANRGSVKGEIVLIIAPNTIH